MVKFPIWPGRSVRLGGFAERENTAAEPGTVTETLCDCSRRPLIPVTVTYMKDPGGALGATEIVSVASATPPAESEMLAWLREMAAGPLDESMSPTMPLKPEILVRVMETVADLPGAIVREDALSSNWNCGPAMLTGTETDC